MPMTPEQIKERLSADDTRRAMVKIGQNINQIFNGLTLINRQAEVLFALLVFDHDEQKPAIVYTTNVPDSNYLAGILRAKAAELAPIPLTHRLFAALQAVDGVPGCEKIVEEIAAYLQVKKIPVNDDPPPTAA